jgi:enoyl-CoA hydratase/carnithine racemase
MADEQAPGAAEPEQLVLLERRDDGVAVITLAHPKVNALSAALLGQLQAVAEGLKADPPGAVVITGGDRIFAAGAEITEFGGPVEAARIGGHFVEALDAVAAIPRMVIAVVNGFALGGGCELALACDLRFASTKAKFGQPEVLLGIIPGAGGTQRLSRLVGPSRAKDIIFTGRFVKADEALAIGMVDKLVPADQVYAEAVRWASQFRHAAPYALRAAKETIDRGLDTDLETGLEMERQQFAGVFATRDRSIGMDSFLNNGPGKAEFEGR